MRPRYLEASITSPGPIVSAGLRGAAAAGDDSPPRLARDAECRLDVGVGLGITTPKGSIW